MIKVYRILFYVVPLLAVILYTSFSYGDVHFLGLFIILGLLSSLLILNFRFEWNFNPLILILVNAIPFILLSFTRDSITRSVPYLVGFVIISISYLFFKRHFVLYTLCNIIYILFAVFVFKTFWFSFSSNIFFPNTEAIKERSVDDYKFKQVNGNYFQFNTNTDYLVSFYNPGCAVCFKNFKYINELDETYCRQVITVLHPGKKDDATSIVSEMNKNFPDFINLYIGEEQLHNWDNLKMYPFEVSISNNQEQFKGFLVKENMASNYSLMFQLNNCK